MCVCVQFAGLRRGTLLSHDTPIMVQMIKHILLALTAFLSFLSAANAPNGPPNATLTVAVASRVQHQRASTPWGPPFLFAPLSLT